MPKPEAPSRTHRRRRPPVAPVALLVAALALASHARAAKAPDVRVVWAQGDRAYLAAPDSLAIAPYSRVSIAKKKRVLAGGEVVRIIDGTLAVVRFTSGSLAREKKLDKLRVEVEPPADPRALRIGFPSAVRSHALLACQSVVIAAPPTHRIEHDRSGYRLVRDAARPDASAWPETLQVRLFDDGADQEIALERGELDVAVFRPGELSAHLRG
ncbi:MAG TPA: hypothetical protein VJY35_14705, partial [Candidatus Eisenbacteria bacterium]|nr:hypothetical protein [Candidatus Eisenbacteria bacterium]